MRVERSPGALGAVAFSFTVLLTTFFHTRVLKGEAYAVRSEENRLRGIPIPAPVATNRLSRGTQTGPAG